MERMERNGNGTGTEQKLSKNRKKKPGENGKPRQKKLSVSFLCLRLTPKLVERISSKNGISAPQRPYETTPFRQDGSAAAPGGEVEVQAQGGGFPEGLALLPPSTPASRMFSSYQTLSFQVPTARRLQAVTVLTSTLMFLSSLFFLFMLYTTLKGVHFEPRRRCFEHTGLVNPAGDPRLVAAGAGLMALGLSITIILRLQALFRFWLWWLVRAKVVFLFFIVHSALQYKMTPDPGQVGGIVGGGIVVIFTATPLFDFFTILIERPPEWYDPRNLVIRFFTVCHLIFAFGLRVAAIAALTGSCDYTPPVSLVEYFLVSLYDFSYAFVLIFEIGACVKKFINPTCPVINFRGDGLVIRLY